MGRKLRASRIQKCVKCQQCRLGSSLNFKLKQDFKKSSKTAKTLFLCTIPTLAVEGVKKFKIVSAYVDLYVL